MNIHCKYDSLVDVGLLKPHPKNRNKHPKDQIERLAKILKYQGVRAPIVVSKRSDYMVKGHGTLQAMIKNGWDRVPVVYQDFEDNDQEWLFVQSDNAIASWAELDLAGINADLSELGPFDIDLIGLKDFTVDPLEDATGDDKYTDKIELPLYEPKGPKPALEELYDLTKYKKLAEEITQSDLPDSVKVFLTYAAGRHIVFQYDKIAEYYAHSLSNVQQLMENSALVIIDFKKAIENGFIKMVKEFGEICEEDV